MDTAPVGGPPRLISMRGWFIVLILGVLVAGFYFWYATSGDVRTPVSSIDPRVDETDRTADPLRDDRAEVPALAKSEAAGNKPAARPLRSEVTLIAIDSETRRALRGFEIQLASNGRNPQPIAIESDRHTLHLLPGSYVLNATRPDCKSPDSSEFKIKRSSTPAVIYLPFTPFEAILQLTVADQTTRQLLAHFRATVLTFDSGSKQGHTEYLPNRRQQPLVLPAKVGQRLVVRIEAEGYTPAEPVEVRFDGSQRKIKQRVFLAVQVRFAGIELRVTDPGQQPIPRLNVVARTFVEGDTTKILWDRTREAKDGKYRLPDLQPGKYRLDISSVDVDHYPTLHLPDTRTIEYFDGQHIIEPITLQPGAMLELRTTDQVGRMIGKGVWVELTHPDGQIRESIWRPVATARVDRPIRLGANKLTMDAPARLHRCLPGGRYILKLQWGRGEPVERIVQLTSGHQSLLEVQLSK